MSAIQIENAIKERLVGETQKHTLDFVAFMRKNEFSCEWFDAGCDGWTPSYKGEGFGTIMVAPEWSQEKDGFILWLGLECVFDDIEQADDDLKEFAWAHVVICPQNNYCKPPYCENSKNHWKVFGREYESTCHAPLAFFNPDANTLENLKKLFVMIKLKRS